MRFKKIVYFSTMLFLKNENLISEVKYFLAKYAEQQAYIMHENFTRWTDSIFEFYRYKIIENSRQQGITNINDVFSLIC